MLQEIETQTLTVTSSAAQAVKDIIIQRNLEGYALRVYVAGGGCCGVNFGMALDNNFNEVDTIIDANGVKVVVAKSFERIHRSNTKAKKLVPAGARAHAIAITKQPKSKRPGDPVFLIPILWLIYYI